MGNSDRGRYNWVDRVQIVIPYTVSPQLTNTMTNSRIIYLTSNPPSLGAKGEKYITENS
jgi:hypothetical protein